MKNLNICIVKDCLAVSRWIPIITVKTPENDNVFEIVGSINVCNKHKEKF